MATIECEWLYCSGDWEDVINIIKLTNNPNERLQEFNDILKREQISLKDIEKIWCVLDKRDIENCTDEWFYDEELDTNDEVIYWFININTGEALHIKYTIKCSGIITN